MTRHFTDTEKAAHRKAIFAFFSMMAEEMDRDTAQAAFAEMGFKCVPVTDSVPHGDAVAWQFRFVFADGKKGAWSNALDLPRNMRSGDSASRGATFEVRDLFAGPVGGGALAGGASGSPLRSEARPNEQDPSAPAAQERQP